MLILVIGNDLNTGETKMEILRCAEVAKLGLGQLHLGRKLATPAAIRRERMQSKSTYTVMVIEDCIYTARCN